MTRRLELAGLLGAWIVLGASTAHASELANNEFMKFKVRLGGFFYGALHLDSNGAGNRPWLSQVAPRNDPAALSFEPYGTRTNLAIESNSAAEDPFKARALLEIDWGPVISPRIRHAYVQLDTPLFSVLMGQSWVPTGTLGPDTYSPNFFNRQGHAFARAPQLSLWRSFGPVKGTLTLTSASLLGGAVIKGNGAAGTYALADTLAPTALLQVEYGFGEKSRVMLTGGVGRVEAVYSGTDSRPRASATTAYGELAGVLNLSALSLTAKAFYGLSPGMGTAVGQTLVVDASDAGAAIPVWGGFASARYVFDPRWSGAVYAGLDNPANSVAGVEVPVQRNLSFGGQVTWTVVEPGALLALEVVRVATVTVVSGAATEFDDVRASLIARYSF